jgi:hypothetical protein
VSDLIERGSSMAMSPSWDKAGYFTTFTPTLAQRDREDFWSGLAYRGLKERGYIRRRFRGWGSSRGA